jgi:hypothetical protein
MEYNNQTTFKWLVEWLPELSIVEVSVEFHYKGYQGADLLDELSAHHLMIGKTIKEGTLKEICADSVKLKMTEAASAARFPRRFGFSNENPDANWVVNITAVNREEGQDITHIDKWENGFYKAFWTHVVAEKKLDDQKIVLQI